MYLQVVSYFHSPQGSSRIPPENQNSISVKKYRKNVDSMKKNGNVRSPKIVPEDQCERDSIFSKES